MCQVVRQCAVDLLQRKAWKVLSDLLGGVAVPVCVDDGAERYTGPPRRAVCHARCARHMLPPSRNDSDPPRTWPAGNCPIRPFGLLPVGPRQAEAGASDPRTECGERQRRKSGGGVVVATVPPPPHGSRKCLVPAADRSAATHDETMGSRGDAGAVGQSPRRTPHVPNTVAVPPPPQTGAQRPSKRFWGAVVPQARRRGLFKDP